MDVIVAQLLTMFSTFLTMSLSCLLPYFLVRSCGRRNNQSKFEGSRYELGISFANCFSGGVFVATFFVGLLPHVREEFQELLAAKKYDTKFPVTEFVVFMGFFLALLVEHVTLLYQEKRQSSKRKKSLKKGDQVPKMNGVAELNKSEARDMVTLKLSNDHQRAHLDVEVSYSSDDDDGDQTRPQGHGHGHSHGHGPHGHSHDISGFISEDGHHHDTGVRFYMLVLSLSVHSIFEGMALGLQSHVADLMNLFVGVIIHECLVAFAMGVSLSKIKPSLAILVKFSILFAIMIPVGQAFGLLVGHENSFAGQVSGAVLQGIAAGTFIHVTFLEVIPAELYQKRYILLKIFFIFLGFMLIVGCIFALGHNHAHSSTNDHRSHNGSIDHVHDHMHHDHDHDR